MSSPSLPERIASLAYSTFEALPAKCKPRILPNGSREWTPMAAITLVRQEAERSDGDDSNDKVESLTCVSLATGTKCLPHTALPDCKGGVLHDSHAEILALRGLNRFLLDEIRRMLLDGAYQSPFVVRNLPYRNARDLGTGDDRFFTLKDNISIYLFTTSPPCGDASMDLLIASRPDDNIPWTQPRSFNPTSTSEGPPQSNAAPDDEILHGHENFSPIHLGRVRLKPSRADAPPTQSKSCTDKLALRQFTGLLGFPLELLMAPTFLAGVVVPSDAYHWEGWERAFGRNGRLRKVRGVSGSGGGEFGGDRDVLKAVFFDTLVLPPSFPAFAFAKSTSDNPNQADSQIQAPSATNSTSPKASNLAALFIHNPRSSSHSSHNALRNDAASTTETLINGVKQGFKQSTPTRQKESIVCRRRMWEAARSIVQLLDLQPRLNQGTEEGGCGLNGPGNGHGHADAFGGDVHILPALREALGGATYAQAKRCALRRRKQVIKALVSRGLGGWVANEGDEAWAVGEG